MRRLVETRTATGLILRETEDGAGVARALREYDPRLQLRIDHAGLWRVYYDDQGRDVFILAWADPDGNPLPLTMRLLDKIRELDRATRGMERSPDELNAAHQKRVEKQRQDDLDAIKDDFAPYLDRGRVSVQIPREP
jgi:hypothetical protein